MRDSQLSVWTRVQGDPNKMGVLYVTENESRFTYTPEFVDSGLPGLSLIYPPKAYRDNTIVHHQSGVLHPRFSALIPPPDEHNFQRKLMLAYLRDRNIEPKSSFEADLALLAETGHGGIGHVDVFANDEEADNWYRNSDSGPLVPLGEQFGASLKDMISWLDADAHFILESLGPTASVGGAIPKLLVAIPAAGWDGRVSLPNRIQNPDRIDVVLKIERTQTYPGLAELEAMGLDVHRDAGFTVPRHWHGEVGGLPALAVERFDRDEDGWPIPTENVFAVLAAGAKDIVGHTDGTLDRIGNIINLSDPLLVSERKEARLHLLRRTVFALLTGNGDMHLNNLTLLGAAGSVVFSPVYDPTAMRAYNMHDLLCAVTFGGYGEEHSGDDPLVDALLQFAKNLGVSKNDLLEIVNDAIAATKDYSRRVEALKTLPGDNKKRLSGIHKDITKRLRKMA